MSEDGTKPEETAPTAPKPDQPPITEEPPSEKTSTLTDTGHDIEPTPPATSASTASTTSLTEEKEEETIPQEILDKYNEIMNLSHRFQMEIARFPLKSNHIQEFSKEDIVSDFENSYPFVHGAVIDVMIQFLELKKNFGTDIEKSVYAEMNVCGLMDRIMTKKAVQFLGGYDSYQLRSRETRYNAAGGWDMIGQPGEEPPKCMENYLTYDELMLSAMCGVSSPTRFINDGNRGNCGRKNMRPGTYIESAIYIGMIGARFEKSGFMEHSIMAVTDYQNESQETGPLSKLWCTFYGEKPFDYIPSYGEVVDYITQERQEIIAMREKLEKQKRPPPPAALEPPQQEETGDEEQPPDDDETSENKIEEDGVNPTQPEVVEEMIDEAVYRELASKRCVYQESARYRGGRANYLNISMYYGRMLLSSSMFLCECNERYLRMNGINDERKAGKTDDCYDGVYAHVVGLGTGVWAFHKQMQDSMIVESFQIAIKNMSLPYIRCIDFSWFGRRCEYRYGDGRPMFEKNENGEMFTRDADGHVIEIRVSKRNPAARLDPEHENCLLIAMYAWDSNAFPGNEYWSGHLSASGDPAAASCSTISFTQNPEINRNINGENTRVFFFEREGDKVVHRMYSLGELSDEELKEKARQSRHFWLNEVASQSWQ